MERLSSKSQESQYAEGSIKKQYLKSFYSKILFGFLLIFILLVISVVSVSTGSMNLSISDVFRAIFSDTENSYIVRNIRITRTVGAILAGASLGVAGAVMQNVLKNPLASPFTLGVSHGAAFGAAFAIIFLGAGQTHSFGTEAVTVFKSYPVVISAFAGALLTVILILFLSFLRNITPEAIILAGVALSSLFGSATMFLQYFASDFQVAATVFWTFGDIGKAGWLENKLMFIAFCICFIYFFLNRWNFNALLWGDEVAKSLGVNIKFLRVSGMFLSAFVVSVCTAFLGIIGFVGLISPHIVRLIIGSDHRFLIPYSAVFGAVLLSISDLIARTIISPSVLPVGIITSFAGAPMFFYLLIKRRRF
ncbi:iron complex transport system permease protein [Thermodesulfovibrio aggregans]|uniref:Iron complex transport system permease protein n=1 Tax=Thermodesulfovibrio aggregans TaxID=86166 RepID=A0A0U9HVF6_9BACT|nr:iron ABC transporter permease [Thermodesulfovibrio aggregans]GAQ94399.1 iron complex transport system permease protein [Thermodesulfovibrio aggregans]